MTKNELADRVERSRRATCGVECSCHAQGFIMLAEQRDAAIKRAEESEIEGREERVRLLLSLADAEEQRDRALALLRDDDDIGSPRWRERRRALLAEVGE